MSPEAKRTVVDGYRAVANGWDRWRAEFACAGARLTSLLIAEAAPTPGLRMLDLGCGVGEPTLSFAPLVAPGPIVGIDIVAEMVTFAERAARTRGFSNATFIVADAEALPFPAASFDLVVCRGAVMHFPDPLAALGEAHRVLPPGGRAVFSALGPEHASPLIEATLHPIARRRATVPVHQPGLDPYRFASRGPLSSLFLTVGFTSVKEHHVVLDCHWPANAERFWSALPEHAWRVAESLAALTPNARDAAAHEAIANLRQFEQADGLHFPTPMVIATGTR